MSNRGEPGPAISKVRSGAGICPEDAFTGAAGGAACGDLIRISVAIDPDEPRRSASPTRALTRADAARSSRRAAPPSACCAALRCSPLRGSAPQEIAAELGGLSIAKRHAAELAADALHRALGAAAGERAALAPDPARTLVAMSGGVDSAVVALLVAQSGAEAVGVTLELWSDPENDGEGSCCSAQAVRGARELAHGLGMPHLSIDLRAEFRAGVVDHWLSDHAVGLTPNPCVRCNGNVRLDAMLELADRLGSETLATGHYARVSDGPLLRTATDAAKDQSYVLSALAPESLARLRFPLGEMRKPEVRELARSAGLAAAGKRDSQDLCFLAGTRHGAFLERHGGLGRRPGPIIDRAGRVLGEHAGAHVFTVGQRHGLGIGGTDPLYVLGTDTARQHGHRRASRRAARAGVGGSRGDAPSRRRVRRRRARALARAPARVPPERAAERWAPRAREARARAASGAHGTRPDRVHVRGRCGRRLRHHRGLASRTAARRLKLALRWLAHDI